MFCPVPLNELVLDDPVDRPRDGIEVPCPDRVQRPLPQPRTRLLTASAPRLPAKSLALARYSRWMSTALSWRPWASRTRLRPVMSRLTSPMARTGLSRARSGSTVPASAIRSTRSVAPALSSVVVSLMAGSLTLTRNRRSPAAARGSPRGTDQRPGPGGHRRQAGPGSPGRAAEAVHGAARCLHPRAGTAGLHPGPGQRSPDRFRADPGAGRRVRQPAARRRGVQGAVPGGQRPVHRSPGRRSPVGDLLRARPATARHPRRPRRPGDRDRPGPAVRRLPRGDVRAHPPLRRQRTDRRPRAAAPARQLLGNCAAVAGDDPGHGAAIAEQARLIVSDAEREVAQPADLDFTHAEAESVLRTVARARPGPPG